MLLRGTFGSEKEAVLSNMIRESGNSAPMHMWKCVKQKIIQNKMHYALKHERHQMNDSHL